MIFTSRARGSIEKAMFQLYSFDAVVLAATAAVEFIPACHNSHIFNFVRLLLLYFMCWQILHGKRNAVMSMSNFYLQTCERHLQYQRGKHVLLFDIFSREMSCDCQLWRKIIQHTIIEGLIRMKKKSIFVFRSWRCKMGSVAGKIEILNRPNGRDRKKKIGRAKVRNAKPRRTEGQIARYGSVGINFGCLGGCARYSFNELEHFGLFSISILLCMLGGYIFRNMHTFTF